MNTRSLLCFASLLLGAIPARSALRVVATTPEYAALASAIGGGRVTVASIAKPTEDPHYVDPRPSHVVALNRADILVEGGAELEKAWLAPLLDSSRNPRILPGRPGRIIASQGIALLDVPAVADRSLGDLHLLGNPHFLMDPENSRVVARHLAEAFARVDPEGGPAYQASLRSWEEKLDQRRKEWTARMAPLRGKSIVTYHSTWRYFARRFGLDSSTYLEPKPGIPPSPPHLASVIARMKAAGMRVILVEPFNQRKTADAVAAQTGARVVEVSQFPGGIPGTDGDYLGLLDAIVGRIADALGAPPAPGPDRRTP